MNPVGLTLATVVCLVCLALPGVRSWPGGAAMYECCCPKTSRCQQSCFMCRNRDFVCDCDQCSCYTDSNENSHLSEKKISNKGLIDMLLKNGSMKTGRHGKKS